MKNYLRNGGLVALGLAVFAGNANAATVAIDTSQIITDIGTLAIGTAITAIAAVKMAPAATKWAWDKLASMFGGR